MSAARERPPDLQETAAGDGTQPGEVQPDEPPLDKLPLDDTRFSLFQLWNMNLGFLGIQFGWGLQMANMSSIFEYLGASAHNLPILWLAAPLTGLIVQPIIGNLSDHTWSALGRRRPYLLGGAIAAAIALVLMPSSSTLWMAAGLLWLLDTSANVSMVPFRAFVGDLLPKKQRTQGFAMQSVMVGLGAITASSMPWLLSHLFGVDASTSPSQRIPLTVEFSFYIGAALFLGTTVWTAVTTPESPPKDLAQFERRQAEHGGIFNSLQETLQVLRQMPKTMQQLALVQIFTWLGIFCFFLYFPPAVARNLFGAAQNDAALYNAGIEWAGLCFAMFNAVCIPFSLLLPRLTRRISRKAVHSICLACGGVSLVSLLLVHQPWMLLLPMVGFGLTWASAQSIPYAILTYAIPNQQRGIYQGIFNFFIVLPEIGIALGFGWVMEHWLHDNRLMAVVIGGFFLLVAAVIMPFVQVQQLSEPLPEPVSARRPVEISGHTSEQSADSATEKSDQLDDCPRAVDSADDSRLGEPATS
ncbi:transporter, major facilitator family [Synechococcus sp. PCC 7335]|uniref:MFS transporter n=1 Tax=Synechococcus sp. (strain ATCC 29403 / PCC 7335) TaxID=91464 RepID=UPI00017EB4B0|nr:MFS transporter [Synechococcus sp. PCC 7335]EDX85203.1 transporter, major facilitator family [Synechococcus sp. PCC 7335]